MTRKKVVHIIYGLYDPTDHMEEVRYVGYTSSIPRERLSNHVSEARGKATNHRANWIRTLLRRNVRPVLLVLETTTARDWQERERYWIRWLRQQGHRLTNNTAGGEGVLELAPESKAKIGAASSVRMLGNTIRKDAKLSQKVKDSISAGLLVSEKAKAAWLAKKGKPSYIRTEEIKKKNSLANIGSKRPKNAKRLRKLAAKKRGKCQRITNGEKNRYIWKTDPIPDGWYLGVTRKTHPLRGKKNPRFSRDLKKLAEKRRGRMKWITDGVKNKNWFPGDKLPSGWRFGKTMTAPRGPDGRLLPNPNK